MMLLVHSAIFVDSERTCEADLVEVEGSFRVWEVGCESCQESACGGSSLRITQSSTMAIVASVYVATVHLLDGFGRLFGVSGLSSEIRWHFSSSCAMVR